MPLPFLLPGRTWRFVISLLHLTEWDAEHWRYALRSRHAHATIGGSAWQSTLWQAVQRAAGAALNKGDTQ